jgi:hypothetical protein
MATYKAGSDGVAKPVERMNKLNAANRRYKYGYTIFMIILKKQSETKK